MACSSIRVDSSSRCRRRSPVSSSDGGVPFCPINALLSISDGNIRLISRYIGQNGADALFPFLG